MSQKKHINGAAMIRVSTAGQADEKRAGIPAQREAVRKVAAAHGIHIAPEHLFELTDLSGARVLESSEYQRFLQIVRQPDISAVVTKEFSRLMRPERWEDYFILQCFTDHGITLYMPDAVIDFSNRQDWLMAGFRAMMAGMERFDIRQRMMDAKEAMRRQGRHPSSASTLARGIGYDRKSAVWFYKENELEPVRLLFKLFLDGERSYHRLGLLCGIPRSTVRTILTNPVYAGVMTYRTKHDLSPGGIYPRVADGKRPSRRKVQREAEEIIRVTLPLEPVITLDQHRLILEIVENMRSPRAQARNSAEPRFVYRGFLRCGFCNDLVYSWVGGRTSAGTIKDFYHCKSRSPREREKRAAVGTEDACKNRYMTRAKVEPLIDEAIVQLTRQEFLTNIVQAHIRKVESEAGIDQAKLVSSQLEKLEAKESRVLEAFLDGNIDRHEKQVRLSAIANQVDELRRALNSLQPARFDKREILKIVSVFSEWPFLQMDEKRRLMQQILPEIYVDRYRVTGAKLRLPSSCNVSSRSQTVDLVTTPSQTPQFIEIFISFDSPREAAKC